MCFETFFPNFFLCDYCHASSDKWGELLRSFDDILKLISTIYLQTENTQKGSSTSKDNISQLYKHGNQSHKFLMQVYFEWQPVGSHQLELIDTKKCLLSLTLLRINLFSYQFLKKKKCRIAIRSIWKSVYCMIKIRNWILTFMCTFLSVIWDCVFGVF